MSQIGDDDYEDLYEEDDMEESEQCDECGYERRHCGCIRFADPGGKSALRAGKRDRPCPNCGCANRLTAEDVSWGYQCDSCADRLERGYD